VFNNWFNQCIKLQTVCRKTKIGLLVFSDISSDLVIYVAISCYIFDRFCCSWSAAQAVTLTFCASFIAGSLSINNLRDYGHPYEPPDLWMPNSPDLIQLTTKSGQHVYQKKAENVNDLRKHLIDVWPGVEQSIIDDGIDQWCINVCIQSTGHFDHLLWHIIVKMLLTVIN